MSVTSCSERSRPQGALAGVSQTQHGDLVPSYRTHFTPLGCSWERVPCLLPSKITCSGEVGKSPWELVSPEGINPVLDWVVPEEAEC